MSKSSHFLSVACFMSFREVRCIDYGECMLAHSLVNFVLIIGSVTCKRCEPINLHVIDMRRILVEVLALVEDPSLRHFSPSQRKKILECDEDIACDVAAGVIARLAPMLNGRVMTPKAFRERLYDTNVVTNVLLAHERPGL